MPSAERPIALHVLTRLILGGPTRPVLTSLEGLRRRGYQPLLACGYPGPHEEEAMGCAEEYPDVPLLRIPSLVRRPAPIHDWRALGGLREAMRRLAPAVVHTHTAKAGALGRLAGLFGSRRPVLVHTFHGHSLDRRVSGRLAPAWRLIERALARGPSDLVLTLSPGQRRDILRHLGSAVAGKVRVQPLPFDPGSHGHAPLAHPPAEGGEGIARQLAFVGRGVPVKGLDVLAAAHARMEALGPGASSRLRIVIIGPVEPGVRSRVLDLLAPAGLESAWSFVGPCQDPLARLRQVDGLVLPSWSEGTPVSILEALWLGLPVLASSVGGVPELLATQWERQGPGEWSCSPVPPRGRLLPPGDLDAWAAALVEFCDNPRTVPGEAEERRAFVEAVFEPEILGADLDMLYHQAGVIPAPVLEPASAPLAAPRLQRNREDQTPRRSV